MRLNIQLQISILSIATLLAISPAARAAATAPFRVAVNGSPIVFAGAAPMETRGALLVPLRGVFEAMQATVNYNRDTHTVTAQKGSTSVILPLGSILATVNGQDCTLSEAAEMVNGTILVPLRFIAQTLGGTVEWNRTDNHIDITTPEPHLAQLPPPPQTGSVTGQITGVYADTVPQQITLRLNGQACTVPVTSHTTIVVSREGRPDRPIALDALRAGEQATVQRGDDGTADAITVSQGVLYGTLKSIRAADSAGRRLITLNDGISVELAPDARFQMNGRNILVSDIMPNERVLIRLPDNSDEGDEVQVNPGNGPDDPVHAIYRPR
ncbi:MAG: stalk domain-containing protein [Capsulimonadaceae bacterium]